MARNNPKEIACKAPHGANVLLEHRDGRLFYAEAFTVGSIFWDENGSNPRALQGIIYNLKVIAKRSGGKNSNIWTWTETNEVVVVPVTKAAPATTPRQERMQKATSTLASARSKIPTPDKPVAPVVKEKVVVQPAVTEPPTTKTPVGDTQPETNLSLKDFMSFKDLNRTLHEPRPEQLFVSFRKNGKIIMSRGLMQKMPWKTMNFLITPDFKHLAICEGNEYRMNKTGTYFHKALVTKIQFPKISDTIRVPVVWNESLKAMVGTFPS